MKSFEITPEIADLLQGDEHSFCRFYITTGHSDSSKDILFVLYAEGHNGFRYMGNLGATLLTAVKNARKRVTKWALNVVAYDVVERRKSCTFPFGKYAGMTVESVFDIDEKYIYWAYNNMRVTSKGLAEALKDYAEIAEMNIVSANKATTNSALPLDNICVERSLTIRNISSQKTDIFRGVVETIYKCTLVDSQNNVYTYKGSSNKFDSVVKGQSIILKCKVVANFEYLGAIYNKINLK